MSIMSLGSSSPTPHVQPSKSNRLRSDGLNHKNQPKNDGSYSTNYAISFDNAPRGKYGYGDGKKSYPVSEMGTIV